MNQHLTHDELDKLATVLLNDFIDILVENGVFRKSNNGDEIRIFTWQQDEEEFPVLTCIAHFDEILSEDDYKKATVCVNLITMITTFGQRVYLYNN